METLLLSALLLVQDPRDRLAEAVRETRLADVRAAIADVVAGDGPRAARSLAANLPRARDRIATLLRASLHARREYQNLDDALSFDLDEERRKNRKLQDIRSRVESATRRAIDAEHVYDALMGAFAALRPEAAGALATEAAATRSWLLKCELLEGLGSMGAREALLAALEREKDPAVLATVLNGVVAADRAEQFLAHPQWQVRLAALKSVSGSCGAVRPIIGALPDSDARFRKGAVEALRVLTKTDLPPDAAVWQDWWKANGEEFEAGRYRPETRRLPPGPGRTTFYDVPVVSTRICFVIDRSWSMREGGRFEAAKKELRRLIDELPDGARVNIVFFGGTVVSFARSTRALDRDARREAAAFIDRQGYESGTDLHQALEKALSFVGSVDTGTLREDGVDTIVALSDGQPTLGRVVNDELMAREIARRARFLRPVIHAVSLGADARSLQVVAELTGGEYRFR